MAATWGVTCDRVVLQLSLDAHATRIDGDESVQDFLVAARLCGVVGINDFLGHAYSSIRAAHRLPHVRYANYRGLVHGYWPGVQY